MNAHLYSLTEKIFSCSYCNMHSISTREWLKSDILALYKSDYYYYYYCLTNTIDYQKHLFDFLTIDC